MATVLHGPFRTNIGNRIMVMETRLLGAAESAATFLPSLHTIDDVKITAESAPALLWTETESASGNASVAVVGLRPSRKVSLTAIGL